jgi:hypothetical protein
MSDDIEAIQSSVVTSLMVVAFGTLDYFGIWPMLQTMFGAGSQMAFLVLGAVFTTQFAMIYWRARAASD